MACESDGWAMYSSRAALVTLPWSITATKYSTSRRSTPSRIAAGFRPDDPRIGGGYRCVRQPIFANGRRSWWIGRSRVAEGTGESWK
ncbi:hypothetical protein N599_13870 [Saccharopolyspora erythraea D]|nr:hypothetical protein N599_13870 [Saccharopolyspora erythraea D]